MTDPARPHIAVFMSTSGHSGVDRAMQHLIPALAGRGYQVDLLKVRRHGPELKELVPGINIIDTGTAHTYSALWPLTRYLRQTQPAALLSDKDRVNRTSLLARWLAGARNTRLVVSQGTTVSIDLMHRGWFERQLQRWSMRRLYPQADQVIVTCEAVADDMSAYTGLARSLIRSVASPVVPRALFEQVQLAPEHPWFAPGQPPVILGVGELSARKDFATLIRAFARLRAGCDARLVIVGKGRELESLRKLAAELGVADSIDFAGYRSDVYRFMAHAAVFAMTSRWEGLGFVLIEALACGTPVVATDCPCGPAEILQNGRYGKLVGIGDDIALATAIRQLLDQPPPRALSQEAARPYEIEAATDAYLDAMQLPHRVST